jgi:hypothetical protein
MLDIWIGSCLWSQVRWLQNLGAIPVQDAIRTDCEGVGTGGGCGGGEKGLFLQE